MKSPRWLSLDALRCTAIVLMVQGHTFYELLEPSVKAEGWYRWHERVHGLTAPMFLFASGLAFGVTTLDGFSAHARFGPAFAQRMRRYALLIAIGYALQLPGQSLIAAVAKGTLLSPAVLRIGPLQAIGAILALCQLMVVLCRRREVFVASCAGLGALVLCISPLVWQSGLSERAPLPLAMWLDSTRGSIFPLFPWATFVFAGIVTAGIVQRLPLRTVTLGLLLTALALALIAPRLWFAGVGPASFSHWATSPFFVLQRLGYVLLTLAGFCALELMPRRRAGSGMFSRWLAQLSRRSLFVYVAHLLILYGTPFTPNLAHRIDATLGLAAASAVSALILAGTILAARAWDELASPERADARRRIQLSFAGLALYCLVARDALGLIQTGLANP